MDPLTTRPKPMTRQIVLPGLSGKLPNIGTLRQAAKQHIGQGGTPGFSFGPPAAAPASSILFNDKQNRQAAFAERQREQDNREANQAAKQAHDKVEDAQKKRDADRKDEELLVHKQATAIAEANTNLRIAEHNSKLSAQFNETALLPQYKMAVDGLSIQDPDYEMTLRMLDHHFHIDEISRATGKTSEGWLYGHGPNSRLNSAQFKENAKLYQEADMTLGPDKLAEYAHYDPQTGKFVSMDLPRLDMDIKRKKYENAKSIMPNASIKFDPHGNVSASESAPGTISASQQQAHEDKQKANDRAGAQETIHANHRMMETIVQNPAINAPAAKKAGKKLEEYNADKLLELQDENDKLKKKYLMPSESAPASKPGTQNPVPAPGSTNPPTTPPPTAPPGTAAPAAPAAPVTPVAKPVKTPGQKFLDDFTNGKTSANDEPASDSIATDMADGDLPAKQIAAQSAAQQHAATLSDPNAEPEDVQQSAAALTGTLQAGRMPPSEIEDTHDAVQASVKTGDTVNFAPHPTEDRITLTKPEPTSQADS